LLLANGAAGNRPLRPGRPAWQRFAGAVREVAGDLAQQIVRDGEGATKFVTVRVNGAADDADARRAARAVANSLLVKTSWFGGDPNWGRVMDAIGYSGARFRPERVEIWYDGLCAVKGGKIAKGASREALAQILKQTSFCLRIELRGGKASDIVYTCDSTYDYVKINAEYTT
jgi:glutamate N-acetyltransferase/amino-acid N-acetyltransferase